jgi:two-component SAPR family response regulator
MLGVLIVEHEPLIGVALAAELSAMGCEPLGPYAHVQTAMAVIERSKVDAAILDINLGRGEHSYPIASELLRRKIPFVFFTGYDDGAIDERFRGVQVFRKPLGTRQLTEMVQVLRDK